MSRGMICADDEIGLVSERSDGILEMEKIWDESLLEKMLGKPVFDLDLPFVPTFGKETRIPLRDTTFEIDNKFITNRPDLFSVIGNAREWGAIFSLNFASPFSKNPKKFSEKILPVTIKSGNCLSYQLLETKNLTVEKSPLSVRILMERAGLSPKNTLVDITNAILVEYGQPMHAFDADKIVGNICVRNAVSGEILEALNGQKYTLHENDLVIADDSGPIALAGIIGGEKTAVSDTTTRVFWEAATFDAVSVRLSSQRHAIRTDASTRFEKSLDPKLSSQVFDRVMQYLDFMGQKYENVAQFSYEKNSDADEISLEFPVSMISERAGTSIDGKVIISILESLDFSAKIVDEKLFVSVPSWRATKDISIAEDIIEEVLRIFGYDNIPETPLSGIFSLQKKNSTKILTDAILSYFMGKNWREIYNYSFTNQDLQEKTKLSHTKNLIAIKNAYTEDFTHMRESLAPRIFVAISENLRHKSALSFFEMGNIYGKNIVSGKKLTDLIGLQDSRPFGERKIIAGATTEADISRIREILDGFFVQIFGEIPEISQENEKPFLHPGASGKYHDNEYIFAHFGKIHPEVAANFSLPENVWYFEIDFENILEKSGKMQKKFRAISPYQAITREFNFVLPKKTETGKIAKKIASAHPWIQNVVVDSVFEDAEKIGKNQKSVTFSLVIQSPENTISDEQSKNISETIIALLESCGYKLRSL